MSTSLKILAIYFLDVVITILLFVAGCILGSTAHRFLTPDWNVLHMLWTMVALLPAAFYIRWREAMNFDGWDILALGTVFLCLGLLLDTIPSMPTEVVAIVHSAMLVFGISTWETFRKTSFPRGN